LIGAKGRLIYIWYSGKRYIADGVLESSKKEAKEYSKSLSFIGPNELSRWSE
jgi:hypothetical protein